MLPHDVQFYHSEESLQAFAGDFLADGVASGGKVVLVSTPQRRERFVERMQQRGVDPSTLIFADARETLARFMVDGAPDAQRFVDAIAPLLDRAGSGARVYGDMVDMLWRDGNAAAAIRLEQLWNDLARGRSFELLCAYALENFDSADSASGFADVCATHAHVLPAESYVRELSEDGRNRQIAALQQRAAALDREVCYRRSVEAALRRSEAHLQDFVDNAAIAIHWVGPDGTILYANDAELRLLGYSRDEYVGRNIAEFHVDQPALDDILCRLGRKESITDYEARLRAKDGSIRWVAISSNALFDEDRFVHTRCFTRDITDRKLLEQERERLLDSAQRANRAKDEFLATLSHELRTPLTAILGWSRMLRSGALDADAAASAVETIERSARAQAALIEDILDLSKIVTGKLALQRDLVDLGTVVDNAIETVRLAAVARNIRIELHRAAEPLIVIGDATRLQQIAWNLFSNAVKFSANGGVVTIALQRSGDDARLVVADEGAGIRQESLPHLFEPFWQAEQSATRHYGGLGLGLAIVKHFAEAHGGKVSAASDGEGRGSTFTVTIRVAPQVRAIRDHRTRNASADLTGRKVLIVDDDGDTRTFVATALRTFGAHVEAADSVAAACAVLEGFVPHVIVTDIAMPGRDGYALVKHVRATFPRIPTIALTAFGSSADAQKILDAGFDDFVAKPIDPTEFATTVANAADRS